MNFISLPSAPPRKHRNLAQGVIAYITDYTRDGSLAAGGKLPTETEIMRVIGVSRSVVREAMSHLQAAGLVETHHGIATFVLDRSVAPSGLEPNSVVTLPDLLAILELRISLETEAAGLAARRRNPVQLEQLRAAVESFRASVRSDSQAVPSDIHFHR